MAEEMTRNSDLVEIGVDEFAYDSPKAEKPKKKAKDE